MTKSRRHACPPESQALQDFDICPRSNPKRAQRKPTRVVQSSEIVDKSQDPDARHCLPLLGDRRIVPPREPILRRWTGSSDLRPTLANESINSIVIGLVSEKSDGQNDGTCGSRTIRLRRGCLIIVGDGW